MANIDRIVRVSISLRTVGITSVSFSDLMLFGQWQPMINGSEGNGETTPEGNYVEIITDADELLENFQVQPTDPIYRAAQVVFSQIPHINQLYIGRNDNTAIAENLNKIAEENNDWYGIVDVSHDETKALDIAAWVEAHEKLFLTTLHDASNRAPAATDTTSVAAQLMKGNYFRTAWWWNPDVNQFPECAAAARLFTKYPGQETWANQRLNAVNSTYLTETIFNNIFNKNGNTFEPFRNISITQNGKVAGGEWIDVIRFRDWLCEEIKVRIFQQMVDNRIPYTDPGIAIIRSRLQEALDMGVRRGGIAPPELDADGDYIPSYTIEVPLASSISANQKASRVLQDVYFTARIAGAIHVVEIQGVLTYENLPVGTVEAVA